jgi:hypothetical protein
MKYIYKTKRQDIWALTFGPASKEEKEEVDSRPRKQQKKTQVYGGCQFILRTLEMKKETSL